MVDASPVCPSSDVYRTRFGGMRAAALAARLEPNDLTTPRTLLTFVEKISLRTTEALARKRANLEPTSHPPFGFASLGAGQRMKRIPGELAVVDRIFALRRSGESTCSIAATLNAEGVPAKRGGCWYHTAVAKVLQRRDWYANLP